MPASPVFSMADAEAVAPLRALADQVRQAADARTRLRLVGGDTKRFVAVDRDVADPRDAVAEPLSMRGLSGIVSYQPTELVVTVRAGTPLAEVEAALAERGQCLPAEPPRFGPQGFGTVGGMVAAGLSGPARPVAGSVRDHVLGLMLLDGRGRLLRFGGEVIKNVAGYDLSRLVAGSWGALGAICEVSLKVMPVAPAECSLRFEMDQSAAIETLNEWAAQPLPLNASVWWGGTLCVRLRGAAAAVEAAKRRLGGEELPQALAAPFWEGLRDQRDEFFVEVNAQLEADPSLVLWRLSLPSTAPALRVGADPLVEWGGAQRWVLVPDAQGPALQAAAVAAGGSARPFRRGHASDPRVEAVGQALHVETPPRRDPLAVVQRRLKDAFDPHDLFVAGAPVAREMAPPPAAA